MPETISERLQRLRPLVPNCVSDQELRRRITDGWDDLRIVRSELAAPAANGPMMAPPPRSRRAQAASLAPGRRRIGR